VFEPVAAPVAGTKTAAKGDEEVFFLKAANTDARGLYTPEGFVVLMGSTGRKANVPSIIGTSDERLRNKLLEAGVMEGSGEHVVFKKDHLFKSPSSAAIALTGRTANGWREWKNADGVTLDKLKRANVEAPT
jgi:hypothetical protein